jgi:hypothetical protein
MIYGIVYSREIPHSQISVSHHRNTERLKNYKRKIKHSCIFE